MGHHSKYWGSTAVCGLPSGPSTGGGLRYHILLGFVGSLANISSSGRSAGSVVKGERKNTIIVADERNTIIVPDVLELINKIDVIYPTVIINVI